MGTEKQPRTKQRRCRFNIDDLAARFPRNADALHELYVHFQDKMFLPTLHDVNIFLYRYSTEPRELRARSAALTHVFPLIAQLSQGELQCILSEVRMRAAGKNDLEIVSDAILGRHGG